MINTHRLATIAASQAAADTPPTAALPHDRAPRPALAPLSGGRHAADTERVLEGATCRRRVCRR